MAIGNLFGAGGESNSLYGTSLSTTPTSFIYFEWFIFKVSTGQPATPTGGSWDFLTNTGIPPTGWVNSINGVPLDNLWFSIAFVDSRNPTNITWSTTGLISATTSVYASAYADKFTGNGSTTSWTLTADPVTVNNLDVSVNGVTQTPGTDYTISGTTFTTTTASPIGSIILVKYRQALPTSYYGLASNVGFTPTSWIASTNVQSALAEIATDISAIDGVSGSNLVGYKPTGTGSVGTTVQAKLRQTVSVKDFGAVGDGTTDDTAAIQAALNAASSLVAIYFPAGNYKITSQITLNTNNVCIFGNGSSQTVITYAGANTTNDIFLMGDNANPLINLIIKGIRVTSTVTMTGGFAFHFRLLVRSYINDVILEGQDGNSPSKLYGGFWFDKIDDVQLTQFKILVLNEGIRVNGGAGVGVPKAGLFINDGKITAGTIGIRVGGAFGGIYVNMTDIIAQSAAGVKIDTGIVAEGNREVFLGQTCVIDSVSAGFGIHVTDALAGGATLQMTGTWVASSSSHGVFFDNCGTWIATLAGCIFFNNGGDALRTNTTNPGILVSGCTIRNSGGYGVNGGLNGNGFRVADCLMFANASGDIANYANQYNALSDYIRVNKEIRISETDNISSGRKLTVFTGINAETSFIGNTNAALSTNMLILNAGGIGNSTAYDYIAAGNTSGGSFRVRGDGQIFADSGTIITPADYAEMFEWVDGNPNNEDRVGCTVSLVGNKIKFAESGESIIGVVSAVPMIVGDAAPFRWQDAFLKDDFGRTLQENVEVLEWVEIDPGEFHYEEIQGKRTIVIDRQGGEKTHSYVHDEIPNGVVVPANATRKTITRSVKNPAWDQSQQYIPRHDRQEWAIIGLLGKLRIKSGQLTNPSWLKMRDITGSISEWLVK